MYGRNGWGYITFECMNRMSLSQDGWDRMNECCMVYLDRIIRLYKKRITCIRQLKPLFNYIFKSCEFKSQKQHVCMKLGT